MYQQAMKFILIFLATVAPFYSEAQPSPIESEVFQLIEDARIPGLSMAYFDQDGINTTHYLGFSSLDTKKEVDKNTVFSAASLSKCVLAYIVMQMVEEGKIDLDIPLMNYFKYEDIIHDARSKKVTSRMVLSHTSGLPNWRNDTLNFRNDPGEKFGYSGEGFVWLQRTIEHMTGNDLEDLAQNRVFTPLGMSRTSYIFPGSFENNHAIPHTEYQETRKKYKPEEGNAAHSLQTTAEDYARFLMAIIQRKGLSDKSVNQMLKPQVTVEDSPDNNQSIKWGLGMGLQVTTSGTEFWHWGDNGTFKAYFTASLDKKEGLVYFTNGSNGLAITQEVVKLFMDSPQPAVEWNGYSHFKSVEFQALQMINEKGFDEAIKPFMTDDGYPDTTLINHRNYNWRALNMLAGRDMENAGSMLSFLAKAYPNSALSFTSLAQYAIETGKKDEAIAYLMKASTLDPDNPMVLKLLPQLEDKPAGNTLLTLPNYSGARMVSVVGSFNQWDKMANLCRWEDGEWKCNIKLSPGSYEYKFYVDGINILDPYNDASTHNGRYHASIIKVEN
jgi:CubicO group peptidase (beta-lactamase class C family)